MPVAVVNPPERRRTRRARRGNQVVPHGPADGRGQPQLAVGRLLVDDVGPSPFPELERQDARLSLFFGLGVGTGGILEGEWKRGGGKREEEENDLKKSTYAVLHVRLVALDLAVDPALQRVDELVQGLVGRGVEGGLVEVVVEVFFFSARRGGRRRGRSGREASIASRAE